MQYMLLYIKGFLHISEANIKRILCFCINNNIVYRNHILHISVIKYYLNNISHIYKVSIC